MVMVEPEPEKKTASFLGKKFKLLFDAAHPRNIFTFMPVGVNTPLPPGGPVKLPAPEKCPHVAQCNATGVCIILGMPPLVPCDWNHHEKPDAKNCENVKDTNHSKVSEIRGKTEQEAKSP